MANYKTLIATDFQDAREYQRAIDRCLAIRHQVFQVDQGLPRSLDCDGYDHNIHTHHLAAYDDDLRRSLRQQEVESQRQRPAHYRGTIRRVYIPEDRDPVVSPDPFTSYVGTLRLRPGKRVDTFILDRMAVLSEHRKHDVGQHLLTTAEALARYKGIDLVVLHSPVTVQKFFIRYGYSVVGAIVRRPGSGVAEVPMEKRVIV